MQNKSNLQPLSPAFSAIEEMRNVNSKKEKPKYKNIPAGYHKNENGFFWQNFDELPTIKTIDVNAIEWWDRSAANSYFSATVTVNFGMPDEATILLPFQYGYGEHYKGQALKALEMCGMCLRADSLPLGALWHVKEYGIILHDNLVEGCKKRDLFQPK